MAKKPKKHGTGRRRGKQCAALPLSVREGETVVMLVTSRDTRRWVLPKGWREPGRTAHEQAGREAFEEAGLVGEVEARPIGHYAYEKRLPGGRSVRCEVEVFAMRVDRQLEQWPEQAERETAWFTLGQAATEVAEEGLVVLLLRLAAPPLDAAPTAEDLRRSGSGRLPSGAVRR